MKRGSLLFNLFSIFLIMCSASFVSSDSYSVYINEVMPNPIDNCSDCTEWIELYSENPINLSGWTIDTNDSKNTSLDFFIEDYFVIAKNKTEFLKNWQISSDIVFESKNISLKNSGDYIGLFNLSIVDETIYPAILENISWNRLENLTFVFCNQSTPGSKNLCVENKSNEPNETSPTPIINFIFPQQVYNNQTNFTIQTSLINFSAGFYDLKLDIKNSTKYLNKFWLPETSEWSDKNSWIDNFTYINLTNFSLSIINIIDTDDLFAGNASLQLKLRNLTSLFYSNVYNITIINGTFQENDSNENVTENDTETDDAPEDSTIKISDSPSKTKFGQEIDIELEIYKGSTSKYAVYIYVQDENENKISEKKTLHLRTKYEDYDEQVSLVLKCLNESGNYKIIAEGLDEKDTESIFIDSCYKSIETKDSSNNVEQPSSNKNQLISENQFSAPNNQITGSAISSNSTYPNFLGILPIILGFLIILLIITIIIKRH